ncbi:unnamed protein product [Adineta ricciae]|uniref:Uncharacterized protein n=1 Tax=Adineta ricciae TaxID=249248 RepID=A0A815GU91_ADIRI|nr:unnamed protein product [Adineta ricciae]
MVQAKSKISNNIDAGAQGLFIQDGNFDLHTLSRYPDRIYLRSIDNIPIENATYILNISDHRSRRRSLSDKNGQNESHSSDRSHIDTHMDNLSANLLTIDQETDSNKIRKRKTLKD